MAVTLPASTGYHERQVAADVAVHRDTFAEHIRDAVENQHWLMAYRARWLIPPVDCAYWDGATTYVSNSGATLEIYRRSFFTGPGRAIGGGAGGVDVRFSAQAVATGGLIGQVIFDVYDDAAALVGTATLSFATASGTIYQNALLSAAAGAKGGPNAWHTVRVSTDPHTATTIRLCRWGAVEEPLAVGDLP